MASIDALITDVMQKVRKCPRVVAINAYRRAARELCQRSEWLRWSQPGQITANKQLYNLGIDPNIEIISIKNWQITLPGSQSGTNNQPNVVPGYVMSPYNANPNITPGPSVTLSYIPEGQFSVSPLPDQNYNVVLTLVVQPTRTTNQIPDVMLRRWDRTLEEGALEYLYNLKAEPWYDLNLSLDAGRKFRAGWNEAKVHAERGYQSNPSRLINKRFIV